MATLGLAALASMGRQALINYFRRNAAPIASRIVQRAIRGGPGSGTARKICQGVGQGILRAGRQYVDEFEENLANWWADLGDEMQPLLNSAPGDIELVEAREGTSALASMRATAEAFGLALEDIIPAAGLGAVVIAAGEKRKSQGVLAGVKSAIADDIETMKHPFRHPWHTIENMLDPLHIFHGSEPDPKRQKTNPVASSGGDFSGLVHTFYDPVTSNIIGYKGIPRKRKRSALERYSPFWKDQMRLTQRSVLVGPSQ